ncbi:hypothetical protein FSARC_10458 [Fusarium sarcochroum]|uniref:Uncharacterized protein n=1 Tax=Fusarium sarcochroum TaxID=1208366 RepID=A0A8H4TM31_9HYPO|nr:hypothetical protein FSARC_10458 [Fusarium sarcochroum]
MAPSLEELAPAAPIVSIDLPKTFNYGPTVLQPPIQTSGEPVYRIRTQTIVDAMPPRERDTESDKFPPVIHFEPGPWMRVPKVVEMPKLPGSYCRMGSIPHGTTINAQGFQPSRTDMGAPKIPEIDITPVSLPLSPGPRDVAINEAARVKFASQAADDNASRRLPQDLSPFMANGTITQRILDDPNSILRDANEGKDIIENTMFAVSTNAPSGAFGGGTSNIGFNMGTDEGLGDAKRGNNNGNTNTVDVTAQYWISKIRAKVELDPSKRDGDRVSPVAQGPRDAVPEFYIDHNVEIPSSNKTFTVAYYQIQYSQMVFLDFDGLKWPHVTVATLAPIAHVEKSTLSSAIEEANM